MEVLSSGRNFISPGRSALGRYRRPALGYRRTEGQARDPGDTVEPIDTLWSQDWLQRMNTGVAYVDKRLLITLFNPLAGQLLNAQVPFGHLIPLHECLDPGREEYHLLVNGRNRP